MSQKIRNLAGDDQDLQMFVETGAIQTGHFKLASGRHSPVYFQCARAFADINIATELGARLAGRIRKDIGGPIDICIAPAIGGIVIGYEIAKQLGCNSVFFERANGQFTLRRGFEIPPGSRVLIVEDVVTTGGSLNACIDLARSYGAHVVGACSLLQRLGADISIDAPYTRLIAIDAPSYAPDELPKDLAALPVSIPGSSARLQA